MKYLVSTVIILLGVGFYWWFLQDTKDEVLVVEPKVVQQDEISSNINIYRNDEWGIAFEYPSDWEIREPAFGSSVSLFNLSVESSLEKRLPDPIVVNITPKYWVERIIDTTLVEEFKEHKIDGKDALYYSSFDMGIPTWSHFILVEDSYWINIAGKKEYENVLDQVIASFEITPVEIPSFKNDI